MTLNTTGPIAMSLQPYDPAIGAALAAEDESYLAPFLQTLAKSRGHALAIAELGTSLTKGSGWLQAYGDLTLIDIDGTDLHAAQATWPRQQAPHPTILHLQSGADIASAGTPDCIYSITALKNGPSQLYIKLLERILLSVKPSGCILIHVPVRMRHSFAGLESDVDGYVNTIPLDIMYILLRNCGYALLVAEEDKAILSFETVYFRIFAIKRPA